jgi:hypothetical protein
LAAIRLAAESRIDITYIGNAFSGGFPDVFFPDNIANANDHVSLSQRAFEYAIAT